MSRERIQGDFVVVGRNFLASKQEIRVVVTLMPCTEEDDDSVMRVVLDRAVSGTEKRGQTKKIWEKQVEEETEKIGLKKEDALNQAK